MKLYKETNFSFTFHLSERMDINCETRIKVDKSLPYIYLFIYS